MNGIWWWCLKSLVYEWYLVGYLRSLVYGWYLVVVSEVTSI